MMSSKLKDSPNDVFGLVFRYHRDHFVHSTLTEVTEQLCFTAHAHVEQTNKYVLLHKNIPQLMTVYSKANLLSSIFFEAILLPGDMYPRYMDCVRMGDLCNEDTFLAVGMNWGNGADAIYEYNIISNEWTIIPLSGQKLEGQIGCMIGKNKIIVKGLGPPEVVGWKQTVKLVDINSGLLNECKTKLSISVFCPCIIQTKEDEVALVGGWTDGIYPLTPSQRVFKGILSENGNDVVWDEMTPTNAAMSNPFAAINLGDEVICAYHDKDGMTKSEIYNITKNRWSEGPEVKLSVVFGTVYSTTLSKQNYALMISGQEESDTPHILMYHKENNTLSLVDKSILTRRRRNN